MELLLIPFPEIHPVALELGPIQLRWYGLAYMFGILFAWLYMRHLVASNRLWGGKSGIKPDHIDDLLIWVTLAIIIGGRLGHVLFYNPAYYAANPLEIFMPWKGGMSFHGGLLASIFVIYLFAKKYDIRVLSLLDVAAAAQPIGQLLGRVANFINGELWGRQTDVPWAMIFPGAGDIPRHPSQLYEAALEGILLFLILRYLTHSKLALQSPGLVGGVFIFGYGVSRIFVEFFREPVEGFGVMIGFLTPGMLYSLPMVLIGIYFIQRARNNGFKFL